MILDLGTSKLESSDIVLVGEYTTSDGPALDDHFLVILTVDRMLHEVPMPSDGPDCAIGVLRRVLSADLSFGLANRTDFVSRVMYPLELKDRPLFRCLGDINADRRKGIISRWWNPSLFEWEVDAGVVDEAIQLKKKCELGKAAQPGATDNPDDAQRVREDH